MLTPKIQEKSRLGTILVKRQTITQWQLEEALVYQSTHSVRLGEALVALELITPIQLKRALRRQNWVRSVAAGVALLVTPFTPALAAGNGVLGSSSTASSHITLTVLPKSQAQQKGEMQFSSNNQATESGFCNGAWKADLFRVKLSGSGNNGDFRVSNQNQGSLAYQASYNHQKVGFQALKANQTSQLYSNKGAGSQCENAYSNQLKVEFPQEQKVANSSTPYSGVLTITYTAE